MTPSRRISTAALLSMLLLVVANARAQDRASSVTANRSGRSATSHYGVPYWQTDAADARTTRPTPNDGVAPRLYERREEPAPVQVPTPRRNYYPGMRTGQYTNAGVVHHCTPSRGQLAGRR